MSLRRDRASPGMMTTQIAALNTAGRGTR